MPSCCLIVYQKNKLFFYSGHANRQIRAIYSMKNIFILTVLLLSRAVLFADDAGSGVPEKKPFFDWNLLWTGSWDESASVDFQGNLNNRLELKFNILPINLLIRAQVLDRRVLNFAVDSFEWDEFFPKPEKDITNFTGGLYHKTTGSRILYGVLDEWGLPARIRNPWISSPPYAENHKVILTDIKTAASGTKEDEAYLYLSTPVFTILPDFKIRGFASFQSEISQFAPAVTGGADFSFGVNNIKLDLFFTQKTLPSTKIKTWFSDPPPLPERDFRLYAAGLIYSRPSLSISSDFAFSETFALGKDIYFNFGFNVTPLLPIGTRPRPLLISLTADAAGERFVFRDGAGNREGFRTAGKIEWRSRYNALFKFDLTLRAPSFGEKFDRSSAGAYYRFPFSARNSADVIRFSVISFSVDRNASNNNKISDRFSGSFGLRLSLSRIGIKSPFGINFAGSINGLSASEDPFFFPVIDDSWSLNSASVSCELTWSPFIFQFKTKFVYTYNAEKDDIWAFSAYASARFKYGRFSVKAESPDFPEKWDFTVTWRLEFP